AVDRGGLRVRDGEQHGLGIPAGVPARHLGGHLHHAGAKAARDGVLPLRGPPAATPAVDRGAAPARAGLAQPLLHRGRRGVRHRAPHGAQRRSPALTTLRPWPSASSTSSSPRSRCSPPCPSWPLPRSPSGWPARAPCCTAPAAPAATAARSRG